MDLACFVSILPLVISISYTLPCVGFVPLGPWLLWHFSFISHRVLFRLLSEGQASSAVSPRRAAPAEPPSRPVSVGQRCSGASLCPAPADFAAAECVGSGTVTAGIAWGIHVLLWCWLQLSLGASGYVCPQFGWAPLPQLFPGAPGKRCRGGFALSPKESSACLIPFNCSNYLVNRCQLLLLKEMIAFAA